jgi:hypothetical protein
VPGAQIGPAGRIEQHLLKVGAMQHKGRQSVAGGQLVDGRT